jgi:hypothetical protein
VHDFETEHAIYRDDAVLEYPQSGERIRGLGKTPWPNKKRFEIGHVFGYYDLLALHHTLFAAILDTRHLA